MGDRLLVEVMIPTQLTLMARKMSVTELRCRYRCSLGWPRVAYAIGDWNVYLDVVEDCPST